jgi:D-alanyl-D-alanine carboxypeptidase
MTGGVRPHQSLLVMTGGNAGFLTSKSGREIAFAIYVMYALMKDIDDVAAVLAEVGSVVEAIYEMT